MTSSRCDVTKIKLSSIVSSDLSFESLWRVDYENDNVNYFSDDVIVLWRHLNYASFKRLSFESLWRVAYGNENTVYPNDDVIILWRHKDSIMSFDS